jgi:hypothetical protein
MGIASCTCAWNTKATLGGHSNLLHGLQGTSVWISALVAVPSIVKGQDLVTKSTRLSRLRSTLPPV